MPDILIVEIAMIAPKSSLDPFLIRSYLLEQKLLQNDLNVHEISITYLLFQDFYLIFEIDKQPSDLLLYKAILATTT